MIDLPRISRSVVQDEPELFCLPEKVVQFGTGAFLRGFVEYFIDAANRAGVFGGRIVAVGSTGSGRDRTLNEQEGLYTLAMRGIDQGVPRREYRLITSLSRALSASEEWEAVLACARNPDLELVFSNTTELGIRLAENDVPGPAAPKSFPGKLTRFLYERAAAFDYSPACGLVVLPCELIENNGDRLKEITLTLAQRWSCGPTFVQWLERSVPFCNTLVDRIVPGEPGFDELQQSWQELGYRDELLTVAETYRLFAIQSDPITAQRLTFSVADPNVVIAEDITPYRERKIRLLNGTHTIMAPLALLAGCKTVGEALADEAIGAFVRSVLFCELVPSVHVEGGERFAQQLLDRFSNPGIQHALSDITLQQTMKLRVRIVPAILDHAARTGRAPVALALGFAAYLLFIRAASGAAQADEPAEHIRNSWHMSRDDPRTLAQRVCSDTTLWGADLARVPGFVDQVTVSLHFALQHGIRAALGKQLAAVAGVMK